MRDFRDAKMMAHGLRSGLAAQGLKITISQSLELIAAAFGEADWNTLAAAIQADRRKPGGKAAAPSPFQSGEIVAGPTFSAELNSTLQRALDHATQRRHRYATLEHLTLALTEDADAAKVMQACAADLGALRQSLVDYLDHELKNIVMADAGEANPTAAFQRVIQHAVRQARGQRAPLTTGSTVLMAIFPETRSPAVGILAAQGLFGQAASNPS